MKALLLFALVLLLCPPARAQHDHQHHDTPAQPEAAQRVPPAMGAHPPGRAADAYFDPAEMARARAALRRDGGDMHRTLLRIEQLEMQAQPRGDGYHWATSLISGGDVNQLQLRTEGEGLFGHAPEEVELLLLYTRAVAAFWTVQAGVRHDILPNPSRTHLVFGIEGIAPYWVHLEGQLFVSHKGEVQLRAEASHDMQLTQQLVLQPRAELALSFQDMPALETGAGVTDLTLGVRLRWLLRRTCAPYLGVEWDRRLGRTATYARRAGADADTARAVLGVRLWF